MENQDVEYEKLLKKVSALEEEILSMENKMNNQVKKEHQILSMEGENKNSRT